MALQSSGPISLSDVNVELGLASNTIISMNQNSLRVLFKKTTDQSTISMSDGYGQSRMPATIEVLVVAGGAGAGAGGGGGGGVIPWFTLTPTQSTSYAVTVGAAGAGRNVQTNGGDGGNSQFTSSYIATGGGGGGFGYCGSSPGRSGGSGGGSGNPCRGSYGSPGSGTAGQGNRGGYGRDVGNYPYLAGGGGGYTQHGQQHGLETESYGAGYALDARVREVAPFTTSVSWGGSTTTNTHVGAGGGFTGHYNSIGGRGAGGSTTGANAPMYGCGGYSRGNGRAGVVVIRYAGTQSGSGGNHITYNANDAKTYHVFTSSGTFGFF